jgi:thymidylate synthase (FAD)
MGDNPEYHIIKPEWWFVGDIINGENILKHIEKFARVCYKSESDITEDISSAKKLISFIIKHGHESVLEHFSISIQIVCDRAMSHEIVRHRLCAFSQESQRYVAYKDKQPMKFIEPTWKEKNIEAYDEFVEFLDIVDSKYYKLRNLGLSPQEARVVLPNCTKTEIGVTANLREWRHIFKLRCSNRAYKPIRDLFRDIHNEFKSKIPVIFDDITY